MPLNEPSAAEVNAIMASYAAAAKETADHLAANPPPAATTPTEPAGPVIDTLNSSGQPNLHGGHVETLRAEWARNGLPLDQFDAAAHADGFEDHDTPDSAAQEAHDAEHGMDAEHAPSDYHPQYGALARTLSPERLAAVNSEATQFVAQLSMAPELGTALIEHVSEIGPRFAAMSPDAKSAWLRAQRETGIRIAGGEAQLAAMKAAAIETINLAADEPFAQALLRSSVLDSWWLLSTLANHSAALDNWASSRPEK